MRFSVQGSGLNNQNRFKTVNSLISSNGRFYPMGDIREPEPSLKRQEKSLEHQFKKTFEP